MSDQEIALKILEQLGGSKFKAMTGATNFSFSPSALSFFFFGCKKTNCCKITLLPSDTYKMEFFKFKTKNLSCTLFKEFQPVFCDQLQTIFTQVTGLETHL